MRYGLLVIMIFSQMTEGQYLSENVVEKSFESTPFFFQPNYMNPFGIGKFAEIAPALIDDPFLNVIVNPAFLAAESFQQHYLYVNFRNTWEINESSHYVYPCRGCRTYAPDYRYIPYYYNDTRQALEPVFSGGYLLRPSQKLGNFTLGITYQMILIDDSYYNIPSNVYLPQVGYDFAGNRSAAAENIPITEKSGGDDEMHQEGHFTAFFAGADLSPAIAAGMRINRVGFSRDGLWGRREVHDNDIYSDRTSRVYKQWDRNQDYDHWDCQAGVNWKMSSGWLGGLTIGYLWGDAFQVLSEDDDYRYRYGREEKDTNWYRMYSRSEDDKSWTHDGETVYGGLNFQVKPTPQHTFQLYYHHVRETVTLSNLSFISDSSHSRYHREWTYQDQYKISDSESESALLDDRSGEGEQSGRSHQVGLALQWQFSNSTRIHFGFNWHQDKHRTDMTESVYSDRFYHHLWQNDDSGERYHAVTERKDMFWDLSVKSTTIQIPVFIQRRIADHFDLLFGVNRQIVNYTIEEETLAIFDYRKIVDDDETGLKERFGERYREPVQRKSETHTSILLGLLITPGERFQTRLLMVPHYTNSYHGTELSNVQWWFDFIFAP